MPGPMDFFRSRLDNLRAHPFQNLMSTVAGGLVPGGGLLANAAFNRYNNNNFNNAASQVYDRGRQQADMDAASNMNSDLGDPRLSGDNGFSYNGPTGPNEGRGSGLDQQLASSLMGGGGGRNGGGPMPSYGPYAGPSMSSQQWNDRGGGYGNIVGQMLGVAPDQSPTVNALLDPISMGAGLPGSGVLNGLHGPNAVRDYREGLALNGPGVGNYGVSNFQVGGAPVIFGSGDPNQRYRNRGSEYGG